MNGFRRFLEDPTPWSKRSIRLFWLAALLTLVMVILAYVLLWFGIKGKVSAWVALAGQGLSILVTAVVVFGAYRARRLDIQKTSENPPERRN